MTTANYKVDFIKQLFTPFLTRNSRQRKTTT